MTSLLQRWFSSGKQRAATVTDATTYAPVCSDDESAHLSSLHQSQDGPILPKPEAVHGQAFELVDEALPLRSRVSRELFIQLRSSLPIVLTLGFEFLPGTISKCERSASLQLSCDNISL
jgi:hypothetical protein